MTKRREVVWKLSEEERAAGRLHGPTTADIVLTFTRKGIEVSGYFDTNVSIGPTRLIPWRRVNQWRKEVMGTAAPTVEAPGMGNAN